MLSERRSRVSVQSKKCGSCSFCQVLEAGKQLPSPFQRFKEVKKINRKHKVKVCVADSRGNKEEVLKETREMRVYAGIDRNYKTVSQSKWLEELGFKPGTPFEVQCENGKLTLKVQEAVTE